MSRKIASGTKRTVSLSVVLGTLLVPLSAVAAIVLTDSSSTGAQARGQEAPFISTTTTLADQAVDAVFQDATATSADLQTACGPAGMELVDKEKSGSITEVQQAALDALRSVCEQEGLPLPGKPLPEPITETVVVASNAAPAATTPPAPANAGDDDYEHDSYEDEEHEEDEHEEDEHEEDEHEEDEHEEDD